MSQSFQNRNSLGSQGNKHEVTGQEVKTRRYCQLHSSPVSKRSPLKKNRLPCTAFYLYTVRNIQSKPMCPQQEFESNNQFYFLEDGGIYLIDSHILNTKKDQTWS